MRKEFKRGTYGQVLLWQQSICVAGAEFFRIPFWTPMPVLRKNQVFLCVVKNGDSEIAELCGSYYAVQVTIHSLLMTIPVSEYSAAHVLVYRSELSAVAEPCPFCTGTSINVQECCGGSQVTCECGARGPIAEFDIYGLNDDRLMRKAIEIWDKRRP